MKFTVTASKTELTHVTLKVEATNEDDAQDVALELLERHNTDIGDHEFQSTEYDILDVEEL